MSNTNWIITSFINQSVVCHWLVSYRRLLSCFVPSPSSLHANSCSVYSELRCHSLSLLMLTCTVTLPVCESKVADKILLHAQNSHIGTFLLCAAPISCSSPSLQFIDQLLSCTVDTTVPHHVTGEYGKVVSWLVAVWCMVGLYTHTHIYTHVCMCMLMVAHVHLCVFLALYDT